MRILWMGLLAGVLGACGGNLSNDDLEFLSALPAREDLASRLPTSQALAANGVGAPSELYLRTHEASDNFNAGLDSLLSMLERIRDQPPTTRAHDRRVWGPARVDKPAGNELRFTMTRADDTFTYQLQVRHVGSGEAGWWTLIDGSFLADGGLRRGTGEVHLDTGTALARSFDLGWTAGQRSLDITYQTRASPLVVRMNLVSAQGAPDVHYTYRQHAGGLGEMTFLILGTDVLGTRKKEDLSIVSRWEKDGRGLARVKVTGGDVPEGSEATQEECWDSLFQLTWRQSSWDTTPEGNAAACPDVSALGP